MSAVRAMAGTSRGSANSRSMKSRARRRCARSAISSGVMPTTCPSSALRAQTVEDHEQKPPALILGEGRAHAHGAEQLHQVGSIDVLADDAGLLGALEHDGERPHNLFA